MMILLLIIKDIINENCKNRNMMTEVSYYSPVFRVFLYIDSVKRILLYGLEETDADKTQIILDNLGIAAYIIGDDVLDEGLGKVFDAQEDFDGRHQEFSTRFMLFDGMKAEELLPVLHTLSVEGQNFDGVKIMLNETNRGWTLRRLFNETYKEHELAKRVIILQEMIQSCIGINLTDTDTKSKNEFRSSLISAFNLLTSGSYSQENVDKAIQDLSESMKGVRKLYN